MEPKLLAGEPPGAGPLTDEELASRVRDGEKALFEVLMRRHNQRVYRAVRSILQDEAEAEDAMQQAYVLAFTHLAQFAGGARFSTWLIRIAVNEALRRLRQRHRLVAITGGEGDASEDGMTQVDSREPNPEQQAMDRELARFLETALDELPDLYRTVFVLREIERLSTAETAEALSVSEDVVKTRLHRAKGLVRERLDARLAGQLGEVFTFHASRCDRVVAAVLARI